MSRRTQRKYKRRRKTKRRRRRKTKQGRRRRRGKTRKKYNKRGGAKIPLQIWVIPGAFNNPSIALERCGCQSLPVTIYKDDVALANNIQGFKLNGCNPYCLFGHVGYSFDDKKLSDPAKKIYGFGPASADFFKNVYKPFPGAITNDTNIFRAINNQHSIDFEKTKTAFLANLDFTMADQYDALQKMQIFYIPAEVDLDDNPMGQLIKSFGIMEHFHLKKLRR